MKGGLKHHASSNEYLRGVKLRNTYYETDILVNRFSLSKLQMNEALLSGMSLFCLSLSGVIVTKGCEGLFSQLSALKKLRKYCE